MFIEANNGVVTREFMAQRIKGESRIVFIKYDMLGRYESYRVKDANGREWQGDKADYDAYCASLNARY